MTRRTPVLLLTALVTAGLLASGCSGAAAKPSPAQPGPGASFPVTVGSVTLTKAPTRIVSLSPTATEMLYAIGAGAQVVAVDEDSDYPPEAPHTALNGNQPNAEAVAAYHPDLVVISNDINTVSEQLTLLHIPVYLAPAAAVLDDTYHQLADLGSLTGHGSAAAAVASTMRAGIQAAVTGLPSRTTAPSVYWELDQTYYSVTSKTFIGSLLSMLGLRNIADPADATGAAGGYPQLSAEYVVKANPTLIFLADTKCCGQSLDTVRTRPGWSILSAVTQGRVIALDDDLASRWGPRLVDLVSQLAAAVKAIPAG